MNRRKFIHLGSSSLLFATLPHTIIAGTKSSRGSQNLFYSPNEMDRIRANTQSDLLSPLYREWTSLPPENLNKTLEKFLKSKDIVYDFRDTLMELTHSAFIQLVDPSSKRKKVLINSLERLLELDHWDYFRDHENKVLGIQRASLATVRILFTRDVLGDSLTEDLNNRILDTVAEKGCMACFRTIDDMNNPDQKTGWRYDEFQERRHSMNMERWPIILGGNNLRAAPTAALGIGAIALLGHDSRAEQWLDTAMDSTQLVMDLFNPDGSYFEGISYAGYTLRTTLSFFDVYQRSIGEIKWLDNRKFDAITEHILTMQAGKKDDGSPDIVNYADANGSVFPCAPAWFVRQTGNPLAQYAVENASNPKSFLDFLWYQPKHPSVQPPASLKNVHNELDWILCRSGWDAQDAVLAFKSGGPANHEHADRNHLIYKYRGERLLHDQFGASYNPLEPGWALRQSTAHNTVVIDGKGQQYHDGEEGTNASISYATIIEYRDHGDKVWWTSDATAAYRPTNHHVVKVLRSVLFAKPDIMVILDQVILRYIPQTVEARFFPDNRDSAARLRQSANNRFSIERPNAVLHGLVSGTGDTAIRVSKLDLPEDDGVFPFVEIGSPKSLRHELVTVLSANENNSQQPPEVKIDKIAEGWRVACRDLNSLIFTRKMYPVFQF